VRRARKYFSSSCCRLSGVKAAAFLPLFPESCENAGQVSTIKWTIALINLL
jgi:hypothetical protein